MLADREVSDYDYWLFKRDVQRYSCKNSPINADRIIEPTAVTAPRKGYEIVG